MLNIFLMLQLRGRFWLKLFEYEKPEYSDRDKSTYRYLGERVCF